MAGATGVLAPLPLIKEATHRTKRGRIAAVVAAAMEWCSQKQQYMKV